MSIFDNTNPTLVNQLRKGDGSDPYVSLTETHQVANGRVVLSEIPDELTKVAVTSTDGSETLVEIQSGSPDSDQYKVDYSTGLITLNSSRNSSQLDFNYKGRGVQFLNHQRIYTEYENGEVKETLKNLTDETKTARDDANSAADNANSSANDANAQAQHAQTQGDYAKSVGDDVKTNWLAPVVSFTDVENTYTSPSHGDTVMTTEDSKVYRYQNGQWDHTQTITDSGISDVQAELAEQDQQTANLVHGTQVIQSDQSSPLKVEFYPRTRINYMGREGSFHNQGKWASNLTIDTSTYKFGDSSGKIDNSSGSSTLRSTNEQKMYLAGKYILAGIWMKSVSGTPDVDVWLLRYDSSGNYIDAIGIYESKPVTDQWDFYYKKIDLTSNTDDHFKTRVVVRSSGTADDAVNFDGFLVEELTQEQFNAIGVSKTDEDVLREHNYIESVQHVKNPVLSVDGSNLLPPFYEWELHDNATVISPYELELNADAQYQSSILSNVKVKSSTSYTFTMYRYGRVRVGQYNGSGSLISWVYSDGDDLDGNINHTFTTDAKATYLKFEFNNVATSGTFTFSQPMLNLGVESRPFVEKNSSYLYAEVTLAGNENKKDISFENENGDWIKLKRFETGVVL